jgi:hypothetical protein
VDNAHTFENYTKYLANNGKSLDYVVTQIGFNEENDNASVLFTPTRFIRKEEFDVTSKLTSKPEVQKLVIMTPYQADTAGKSLPAPAKATAKAEESDEAAEPVKRESKKAATPAATKKDLDSVLKAWTDEE